MRLTTPFGNFEMHWLLERAPERVRQLIRLSQLHPELVCGNAPFQTVEGNQSAAPSSFPPVASTNVETNLWVPADLDSDSC